MSRGATSTGEPPKPERCKKTEKTRHPPYGYSPFGTRSESPSAFRPSAPAANRAAEEKKQKNAISPRSAVWDWRAQTRLATARISLGVSDITERGDLLIAPASIYSPARINNPAPIVNPAPAH